jgi:hypothetical protein
MKKIELTLTLDETNLVLEGLGQLAYAKVYALVGKIQAQAGNQIRPTGAKPEPASSRKPDPQPSD